MASSRASVVRCDCTGLYSACMLTTTLTGTHCVGLMTEADSPFWLSIWSDKEYAVLVQCLCEGSHTPAHTMYGEQLQLLSKSC
jgi:hypothetical protein